MNIRSKKNTEHNLQDIRTLIENGKHDEAQVKLLNLLKQEPDNRVALLALGGLYFTDKKYTEAKIVFEKLVSMDQSNGTFSIALFNTLWKLGQIDEAVEEIRRFILVADKTQEEAVIRQYAEIIDALAKQLE